MSLIAFVICYLFLFLVYSHIDNMYDRKLTKSIGNWKYIIIFILNLLFPFTLTALLAYMVYIWIKANKNTN